MDRILVVDDSQVVRQRLATWLGSETIEVSLAENRARAREAIRNDPPDLVLLDLQLPDGNGLELCRELKSDEVLGRIPIVILTVDDSEGTRVACLAAGADEFLVKPGSRAEIQTRVQALLRAKRLSDRLLISYHELDRLGNFAEGFVNRSMADWSRQEVAEAMARHVLAPEGPDRQRPRFLWAGRRIGTKVLGGAWLAGANGIQAFAVTVPVEPVMEWLETSGPGEGAHIIKGPVGRRGARALGVESIAALQGVVALARDGNILIAAGYPWEVGSYELALLRAMHRHWNAFERIRQEALQTERAFFLTMDALALAAEFYQHGTAAHIRRVGTLSGEVARLHGKDRRFVRWISQSAKLHDVGKITIPLELLTRDDDLGRPEVDRLQRHTVDGERLLSGAEHLAMARRIARSHHECWDGSGYPDGLQGEEIPYEARIVKLADVYDALRSERSYKPAFSHDRALEILTHGDQRVRPSHFDPELLDLLLVHGDRLAELYRHADTTGPIVEPSEP